MQSQLVTYEREFNANFFSLSIGQHPRTNDCVNQATLAKTILVDVGKWSVSNLFSWCTAGSTVLSIL